MATHWESDSKEDVTCPNCHVPGLFLLISMLYTAYTRNLLWWALPFLALHVILEIFENKSFLMAACEVRATQRRPLPVKSSTEHTLEKI